MEVMKILLAEDDPNDIELTLAALQAAHLEDEVAVARDGAEVLDYLRARGQFSGRPRPHPRVVFLDLKMPKVDGLEVLRQMKSDPQLRNIPVVVFTSSREKGDVLKSYELHVNAYVVKPIAFEEFTEVIHQLSRFWLFVNEPPERTAESL